MHKIETPQISIIVPVYKVEPYIKRCLDSILGQTYTDWECVIIDDGSPDDSGKICDGYADKDDRFRVIHKKNEGSASTRNVGLANTIGKFIVQVDSDDYLPPDAFESLIKKQQEADYDIVFGDYTNVFADRKEYCSRPINNDKIAFLRQIASDLSFPHYVWATLIKTELYIKYNIRVEKGIDAGDDLQLLAKLIYHSKSYAKINKSTYFYNRTNVNSITQSTSFKRLSQDISSIDIVTDFFRQMNETVLVEDSLLSKYNFITQFLITLSNKNDSNFYTMRTFIQENELKQIYDKLPKRRNALVLKINNLTISRIYCQYLRFVFILTNIKKKMFHK